MHAAIPTRRHLAEKARAQIQILHGAGLTRINHRRAVRASRGRVEDGDGGATFWVRVRVGGVLHHGDEEGDDCVGVGVLPPARAQPRAVVGDVPRVAESSWDEDEGGEDEVGEWMHGFLRVEGLVWC